MTRRSSQVLLQTYFIRLYLLRRTGYQLALDFDGIVLKKLPLNRRF